MSGWKGVHTHMPGLDSWLWLFLYRLSSQSNKSRNTHAESDFILRLRLRKGAVCKNDQAVKVPVWCQRSHGHIFRQVCSFINTLRSCLTWQTYLLQPPSVSFLILPSQYSSFKACIPKWQPPCTQCTFASHNYSLIITDTKNVIFSPFDILKTYDHFLI